MSVAERFGCPLYDPGQRVRFDKIAVLLTDEAGEYKMQVERAFISGACRGRLFGADIL